MTAKAYVTGSGTLTTDPVEIVRFGLSLRGPFVEVRFGGKTHRLHRGDLLKLDATVDFRPL